MRALPLLPFLALSLAACTKDPGKVSLTIEGHTAEAARYLVYAQAEGGNPGLFPECCTRAGDGCVCRNCGYVPDPDGPGSFEVGLFFSSGDAAFPEGEGVTLTVCALSADADLILAGSTRAPVSNRDGESATVTVLPQGACPPLNPRCDCAADTGKTECE